MPEYTFRNPPAREVTASIRFLNNLRVANERDAFHKLIKAEFPLVVMPELKNLNFDFGDYSLYSENLAFRVEISMNYFRLVSTPYSGFASFSLMFLRVFGMFSHLYEMEHFTNLTLRYSNSLPVESGKTFEDYFAIQIKIPGTASQVWAGQGTLAIQEKDGRTFLELEPEFSDQAVSSYKMNLTFTTENLIGRYVEHALNAAHEHLRRYFFSCLKPEYLEILSTK